nr:MAG TPA: hypothetical protein [Caudoviricetes sp.]
MIRTVMPATPGAKSRGNGSRMSGQKKRRTKMDVRRSRDPASSATGSTRYLTRKTVRC